jgi:hypothetical protein
VKSTITIASLGLAATVVLAGCSEADDSSLQELTESILESTTDSDVEINDDSIYIASPDGGGIAAGVEVELPPAFPAEVPLFAYGTLIAATVDPGQTFSATWRMEEGNPDFVYSYVEQWEMMGFERDGFLDMASNSHRALTYTLIGPDMEVGISATISEGDDDSVVSIAGSWK